MHDKIISFWMIYGYEFMINYRNACLTLVVDNNSMVAASKVWQCIFMHLSIHFMCSVAHNSNNHQLINPTHLRRWTLNTINEFVRFWHLCDRKMFQSNMCLWMLQNSEMQFMWTFQFDLVINLTVDELLHWIGFNVWLRLEIE